MNQNFYYTPLTVEDKEYITGKTYPADPSTVRGITYEDLVHVHVLHIDFDGQTEQGDIICNRLIADDLVEIFRELYEKAYPIEQIRLIDAYDADDLKSMADNNSSAFNYRVISGTDIISNHGYGVAIDINPLYNPYVFTRNGKYQVQPLNAYDYVERTREFAHKIDHDDLCYQVFLSHGFEWGGDWTESKDYQHFEKTSVLKR